MAHLYSIDYTRAKQLRLLASSRAEMAAIDRLAEFIGDASDMLTAAGLYQAAGEGENAAELLRMLPPGAAELRVSTEARMKELALGVCERLTARDSREFENALAQTDPDEDERALRNDYSAVYDAIRAAVAPVELELRQVAEQRDEEVAKRRAAQTERDALGRELSKLHAGVEQTLRQAEGVAGRIARGVRG